MIYKKGTKIRLWCSTNFINCGDEEEMVLERDYTKKELEEIVNEFSEEIVSPSWGFEVLDEKK